jgi:hypothetical protein
MECKHRHENLSTPTKWWVCASKECQGKQKDWLRVDNFRTHIKNKHRDEDVADLVRR